jgi:hypothetical protein
MTVLLDTMLAPTSVESGRLVPRTADVSVSEVFAQASALAEPYLADLGSRIDYGNVDVPQVWGDAALLTQAIARLVVAEAMTTPKRMFRLEASESNGRVAIELRSTSDESLTTEPVAEVRREEIEDTVSSWFAPAELIRQMGGSFTRVSLPGGSSAVTINLATEPPSDASVAGPVVVWPPIAFELPGARPSAVRRSAASDEGQERT